MGFMKNILSKMGAGALVVGASMALAPMTASASVVSSAGITGGCESSLTGGLGFIDVAGGGGAWNASFSDGEAAGQCLFNLTNTTGTLTAITIAVATIQQSGLSTEPNTWGFVGGAGFSNGALPGGPILWEVAEGEAGSNVFNFTLAPGETQFFDPFWGEAYASGFTNPVIDFSVNATPVPLPAAGFLLLGALGGMAVIRRKRKDA